MMHILPKIAWRNIWRNKRRSLVIIISISLGLTGGNFISSAYIGMMNQTFEETIEKQISHIQIHNPDFIAEREVRHNIENADQIVDSLRKHPDIRSAAARTVLDGMIQSPRLSAGVNIIGVEPQWELRTTNFDEQIIEGTYFEERGRLPSIIIGRELSRQLQAGPGSRIVLTFQDIEGEILSSSFRVEAIFRSSSSVYEEMTVFVESDDLNELVGDPDIVTEIAILLHDHDQYRQVTGGLKNALPGLTVRSWDEIAPDLEFIIEITQASLMWIMAIIILGVAFGILNTILMSVLERTHELGMLMSVGMKRARIFSMVVLETVFLSLTGGAAGFAFSFFLVRYLNQRGMDLTAMGGEILRDFGFSPVIYPELNLGFYIQVGIMIVVFAILASVYPAIKAVKLQPAAAVRKQ